MADGGDRQNPGRFGEMDDLAGAVAYLVSDAARYVTGQCLAINGGTLASL
jgi:gluconate 5-dehydrogenase